MNSLKVIDFVNRIIGDRKYEEFHVEFLVYVRGA